MHGETRSLPIPFDRTAGTRGAGSAARGLRAVRLATALFLLLIFGPGASQVRATGPTLHQYPVSGVGVYEHVVPGAPPGTSSVFSFNEDHFLCAVAGGGESGPFNMLVYSIHTFHPGIQVTNRADGSRLIRLEGAARTITTTTAWPGLDVAAIRSLLKDPSSLATTLPDAVDPDSVTAGPGIAEDAGCTFVLEAIDNDGVLVDGKEKPDHLSVTIYGSPIFSDEPGRDDGGWKFEGPVYLGDIRASCPSTPEPLSPCISQ